MKREIFKTADGVELPILVSSLSSSDSMLSFRIRDADTGQLEKDMQNTDKTAVFTLVSRDEDSMAEETLKAWAGFSTLAKINVEYGKIVAYDYNVLDETTASGFKEVCADETYVELVKKPQIEKRVTAIENDINEITAALTGEENG